VIFLDDDLLCDMTKLFNMRRRLKAVMGLAARPGAMSALANDRSSTAGAETFDSVNLRLAKCSSSQLAKRPDDPTINHALKTTFFPTSLHPHHRQGAAESVMKLQ
jgi:hypothetical protein